MAVKQDSWVLYRISSQQERPMLSLYVPTVEMFFNLSLSLPAYEMQ